MFFNIICQHWLLFIDHRVGERNYEWTYARRGEYRLLREFIRYLTNITSQGRDANNNIDDDYYSVTAQISAVKGYFSFEWNR